MAALADSLLSALDNASLLLLPSADPAFDEAAAYALAAELRAKRIARGEQPRGLKIGFTNRLIWPRYNVTAPAFATVWDSSISFATPEARISLAKLSQPRIEPEVVFGFGQDVPTSPSAEQLAACISWAAHGFEIVQTHFADWKFTLPDCAADFGMHGRLLIGKQLPINGNLAAARSLSSLRLSLWCDGERKDEGLATQVLDGPFEALLYLTQVLASTPNAPSIKAGDVITTGTITDAWPVQAGQTWRTEVSNAPLRSLSVKFTA